METLSYEFKDINFNMLIQANFRKYFHEDYKKHIIFTEISRKLIDPDILEIYRVNVVERFYINMFTLEKIIIDRKNKIYKSIIDTKLYKEECKYKEILNGVIYEHKFALFIKYFNSEKLQAFKKGCSVIEEIISSHLNKI